ncbi:uncharacterized protein LOC120378072 isoform X1 [Mauremys reevesii]|uniref:uncharacterized protein LOC120378072 isoform X1 n=1 Tax=Mauremys reevesii TaxID=260615 RepID=UPI00193FAF79|nr:uncharacterized protein LOC120378072 isoform X1 [Mauremys reevesii]
MLISFFGRDMTHTLPAGYTLTSSALDRDHLTIQLTQNQNIQGAGIAGEEAASVENGIGSLSVPHLWVKEGLRAEPALSYLLSLFHSCPVPLEKFPLAQSLRLLERRLQYVARHLDEVLILPSVSTSAMSQFSYSSMESTTSSLWSPSSFSLTKASVTGAEPLCHTRDSMPVASWEGSTHPIQAQPLPRPPAHSRRDRREQTIGLDQTSAQGSDFNIQQKYLQSQLGAPQTPIPGESLLSEWDTKQQLELDTDPPNVDFQQRSQSP